APFIDKCFELVSPLYMPPTMELPPTTRPVATAPADGVPAKVILIALPAQRMVVVAQLVDSQIVRENTFAQTDYDTAKQTIMILRRMVLRSEWFDPKEIERRCDFVRARTEEGSRVPINPTKPEPVAPESNL